jgi:uncharacterized membrane protein YkvA (DUF1232 family)
MASRAGSYGDHGETPDDGFAGFRPPRLRRGHPRAIARRETSWLALARELPSVARLVFRLGMDPRVSRLDKVLLAGAAAYVAAPADLIPDWIPVLGQMDDLVVVGLALHRLLSRAGPDLIAEHWDGDELSLETLLHLVDRLGSRLRGGYGG